MQLCVSSLLSKDIHAGIIDINVKVWLWLNTKTWLYKMSNGFFATVR